MTNSLPANLPPILEKHYHDLNSYPRSPLKEYYSRDRLQEIETVYVEALKKTVPKTTLGGGVLGLTASLFGGFGFTATALSALGGAFAGGAAGFAYETHRFSVKTKTNTAYLEWKKSIDAPILESFKDVIKNHKPFEELTCCLTEEVPIVGVRDRLGMLYDRDFIYQWIDSNGTNPFTRELMTRKDVTFCPDFANQMQGELIDAFKSAVVAEKIQRDSSEGIIRGLQAALGSIITNHNEIILQRADEAKAKFMRDHPNCYRQEAEQIYIKNKEGYIDIDLYAHPQVTTRSILTAESSEELKDAIFDTLTKSIYDLSQTIKPPERLLTTGT